MAGKGDKPRPVDKKKFASNYDDIYKPKFRAIIDCETSDELKQDIKIADVESDAELSLKRTDRCELIIRSYILSIDDIINIGKVEEDNCTTMRIHKVERQK
jgi:hypothetical protein